VYRVPTLSTYGVVQRISRNRASSDVNVASRCRFLGANVVVTSFRSSLSESSPSVDPRTVAVVDALGSASLRAGDAGDTNNWRAGDAMGNASVDSTSATYLASNGVIH
jgi:hypothetical protein